MYLDITFIKLTLLFGSSVLLLLLLLLLLLFCIVNTILASFSILSLSF